MGKELRLIVQGLIGGLRTIFWAFVFMFFFILALSITARQMITNTPQTKYCEQLPWGCTMSEEALDKHRAEIFGNLARCMFTLFRCFIADGCSTVDGTPLMPLLWDE